MKQTVECRTIRQYKNYRIQKSGMKNYYKNTQIVDIISSLQRLRRHRVAKSTTTWPREYLREINKIRKFVFACLLGAQV